MPNPEPAPRLTTPTEPIARANPIAMNRPIDMMPNPGMPIRGGFF